LLWGFASVCLYVKQVLVFAMGFASVCLYVNYTKSSLGDFKGQQSTVSLQQQGG